MKVSLLKLIDVSILPAVLAVGVKFLGLMFALKFLNLTFSTRIQGFFPELLVDYSSKESEIISSSVSVLFTGITLGLGCGLLLVQAHFFHETHISPKSATNLARKGLSKIITSSFDVFHRLFIWLSLLWLVTFLSFYQTFHNQVSIWVSLALLFISWGYTQLLALDMAKERTND
ncbi:MAG: hypothetical protein A3J50_03890 [Candidatus Woykebacteria bacterium RIFCSPHIGHO2_02_FULL_43_16b]|uniref:Uncharacterized protein n=1 Tax=Candidatus Woykebacteria bacterium RIFCSPHIGHO2_02_FULL_43_16b TaxID=1802601 RepID=A0A1G1WQ83_9BACT|nr:MAG: hypothetical protein A3J50_03890 [Candidatus Woykebacteria bacterium RIFCSPHIGHO2_02_FULL_43_16b]